MATLAATNYTESHHKSGSQYETDGDGISTTLSIQTGYSSDYRSHTQPSRLSRHSIKLKSSSSFPNLLSLYHTPIREESNLEEVKKKQKVPKRERRRKDVVRRPDLEEQHADKRTRHESRQIRMDAVAKEQIEKFDTYVLSMKQKVDRQREERRKYNEILQERLREQEEMEKRKLRLHRGPKHVYIHDRKYLKTLPVSRYCKATRLADDLQRKGVLRTRADLEKYWSGIGTQQNQGVDIFSDTASTSVNYPHKWMGSKKPEIKVTDDDDDHLTDAVTFNQRQLPPLRKKKKKRPEI